MSSHTSICVGSDDRNAPTLASLTSLLDDYGFICISPVVPRNTFVGLRTASIVYSGSSATSQTATM